MFKNIKKKYNKVKCFIQLYSKKIDELDVNVKTLINKNLEIENAVKNENRLILLEEQVQNLKYKLNELATYFDCINLEYLNLDSNILKKRVLIVGFYGAPNLGDELMLFSILNKISSHDNVLDITVMLSENYTFDITNYPKCKIIHYPRNIMDINILATYFDVVIFGGGALLDDTDYNLNKNGLSLYAILINLAYRMITCKKKVILYGLSSNCELQNREYIRKLSFIVNNASYFSLRDTFSLETLKNCDINVKKINIVHDLVFTYNYSIKKIRNKFFNIGLIYVCNEDSFSSLCSLTKDIINYLNKKKIKYRIIMIPFYEYLNNDTNYYNKIKKEIGDNAIEVLEYPNPIDNIFKIISNLDVCISMRYHGTLISNMLGVSTINLLYDCHRHYNNKLSYLYKNYKFKDYTIRFSQLDNEEFIKKFDCVCKYNRNPSLKENIIIEANQQLDNVISEFILK